MEQSDLKNNRTIQLNNSFVEERFDRLSWQGATVKDLEELYNKIEKLFPKVEYIESELSCAEFMPPKKRQYLYLAGAINNDPRTYEWREKFIDLMKEEPHIVVINPCASRFNQGVKHAGNNGMEYIAEINKQSQRLLRSRDYQFLRMASIMLVNFGYCTPDKPLIGTLQEITWAADVLFLPIIAITNGEINAYTEHPWLQECVSAKVETVEEAAEMIKKFFLEY